MASRRLTMFLELEEDDRLSQSIVSPRAKKDDDKPNMGQVLWRLFKLYVPICDWLPKYNRYNLLQDILAGVTVAIVCIPNGLANAALAGVPTLYGIFSCMIPPILYAIFGSSKHLNVGVYPLIAVMAATAVKKNVKYADNPDEYLDQIFDMNIIMGIILLLCGTFRIGAITALISDSVLAGFTVASAYNIAAGQLKHLFGAEKYVKSSGPFFPYVIDLFSNASNFNWSSFALCFSALIILIVGKRLNHRFLPKIQLPFELFVVILYTMISGLGNLNEKTGIKIVGTITKGYPSFRAPKFHNFVSYLSASIPACLISYVISISSGKTLGRQYDYRVRPNQELRALGFGSFVGGFLQCFPVTGSMSRSYTAATFGGNVTAFYNIIAFAILSLVVLFIAPIMKTLPEAVLGALVISAFEKLYIAPVMTYKLFKQSKLEFLHWWVVFGATIGLDTEIGLYVGIAFCFLTQIIIIFREAHQPDGSYYREFVTLFGFETYHDHISDTTTIKFRASLHYLNMEAIFNKFLSLFNKNPPKYHYVFDFDNVKFMDITSVNLFADLLKLFHSKKLSLSFSHMSKDVTEYLKSFDIPVINDVFQHTVDQYTYTMDVTREFTEEELHEEGRSAVHDMA